MAKEDKKELAGKVYRQFSRHKYNKYRAQFPRLRQAQIVSMIIRQWDALTPAQKSHFQKIYRERQLLTTEDIDSSQAYRRAQTAENKLRQTAKRQAQKLKSSLQKISEPQITSFYHSSKRQEDGSDINQNSQIRDQSRRLESQSPVPKIHARVREGVQKYSHSDYIKFFKAQQAKLKAEHPKWNSLKISSMIKLLWQKKKNIEKKAARGSGIAKGRKSNKFISGYRRFRKQKNLEYKQAKLRWSMLPFQSKKWWQRRAQNLQPAITIKHRIFSLKGDSGINNLRIFKQKVAL